MLLLLKIELLPLITGALHCLSQAVIYSRFEIIAAFNGLKFATKK